MNAPTEFDTYIIGFLNRGPRAAEFSGEALALLQEQHLAHLAKLHQDGFALAAGPFEVPAAYVRSEASLSFGATCRWNKSKPSPREIPQFGQDGYRSRC